MIKRQKDRLRDWARGASGDASLMDDECMTVASAQRVLNVVRRACDLEDDHDILKHWNFEEWETIDRIEILLDGGGVVLP